VGELFYKVARLDGWDFYTGWTINYRQSVGKIVRRKKVGKVELCTERALHASRNPDNCFIAADIPCSVFLVEGKPYADDGFKCGFKQLRVVRELDPREVFKWRYVEACYPIHPLKINPPRKIGRRHIKLLRKWHKAVTEVGFPSRRIWAVLGREGYDMIRIQAWRNFRIQVLEGDGGLESNWKKAMKSRIEGAAWGLAYGDICEVGAAYIGHIFHPVIEDWGAKGYKAGEYPYQAGVDLMKMGLVPTFDGKIWRLNGGLMCEVLWEGTL